MDVKWTNDLIDIKWTNDLSVRVDSIDDQHKELIAIVDNLLKAINRGDGKDEIEKVMAFLKKYVTTHFAMEEALMSRIKYPKDKFLEHERQHTEFWENFNELVGAFKMIEGFKKDYHSPAIVDTIKKLLVDWLINHICKTDKAIGGFVKKR
ncbi:MAG: hemerythrin family protein [Nitrospirae bacterium]|nr:hemerythrin family protein [Nitrospirota bacterium]